MPEFEKRGYLRVDLTDNCNIRCIMCQLYNSVQLKQTRFLDFAGFANHTREYLHHWQTIQLGNAAEPTTHPDFGRFVKFIREHAPKATIYIVTNGKLLARYTEAINEAGNCTVQVSMDSITKDIHEYIRVGSKFDGVLSALKLLNLDRVNVLLSFTLMSSNIAEYPRMLEFCNGRGYQMSAFPMIVRAETGIVPFDLLRESLWFHREALDGWLRTHYGAQHSMMVGAATGAMPPVEDFWCNAHWDDLNIAANGDVNLCGKVTLGNALRQDLDGLWYADFAAEFRSKVEANREPCQTCDYRQRCLSPSMALMANHFSEQIMGLLSPSTAQRIAYDRTLSDDDAILEFVRDIGESLGVFDLWEAKGQFHARRVNAGSRRFEFGPPISSPTRYALHEAMKAACTYDLDPALVSEGFFGYNLVRYLGKFWAIPQSLGPIHLGRIDDQRKPGILTAGTLTEIQDLCSRRSELVSLG